MDFQSILGLDSGVALAVPRGRGLSISYVRGHPEVAALSGDGSNHDSHGSSGGSDSHRPYRGGHEAASQLSHLSHGSQRNAGAVVSGGLGNVNALHSGHHSVGSGRGHESADGQSSPTLSSAPSVYRRPAWWSGRDRGGPDVPSEAYSEYKSDTVSLGGFTTPGQLLTPSPSPPIPLRNRRGHHSHRGSQQRTPPRSPSRSRSRSRGRDGNSQHQRIPRTHSNSHNGQNVRIHHNSQNDSDSPHHPPSGPSSSGNGSNGGPPDGPGGPGNSSTPSGPFTSSTGPIHHPVQQHHHHHYHDATPLNQRHQNFEAYVHFKDAHKFNVKISGEQDENLMHKIFDLEQWQNMTKSDDEVVHKLLLSKGLEGRAKERVRQQQRQNPHKVATKDGILNLLLEEFDWQQYSSKLFKAYRGQKQDNTPIKTYYREFMNKYDDMRTTYGALKDRLPPWNTQLLMLPTVVEAYRVFLNSLNTASRDRLLQYVQLQHTEVNIEALAGAVDYVQGVMHPYGLKSTHQSTERSRDSNRRSRSKSSRTRSDIRSRSNTRDSNSKESNRWERRQRNRSNRRRDRTRSRGRRSRRDGTKEDRTCHECGKKGHIAKDCWSKSKKSDKSNVICYKCGKPGHYARKCTSDSSNGQSETSSSSNRNNSKIPKPTKRKHANFVQKSKKLQVNFMNAPRLPFPATLDHNKSEKEHQSQQPRSNVSADEMNNVVFDEQEVTTSSPQ